MATVTFTKTDSSAILPTYPRAGSSGMTLHALNNATLDRGDLIQWVAIPTGLTVDLPAGYEAQIRTPEGAPREWAVRFDTVPNDFTDELIVYVLPQWNGVEFLAGDVIAQLVLVPIAQHTIVED